MHAVNIQLTGEEGAGVRSWEGHMLLFELPLMLTLTIALTF